MCLIGTSLFSQKYYHMWPYGATIATNPQWPNLRSVVDFNDGDFFTYPETLSINFRTGMAAISDSLGQLSLYTNGHFMMDGRHKPVSNGSGLNPSKYFDVLYQCNYGAAFYSFIRWSDHQFSLIHLGLGDSLGLSGNIQFLYRTNIQGNLDTGFEAIGKNTIIAEGFFERFNIVKHADGLNYWVFQPWRQSDTIRAYYLSADTMYLAHEQKIGPEFDRGPACYAYGINSISQDGQKYVRFLNTCGLLLYDIDRCTGLLSNPREIPLPTKPINPGACTEFSPNSRFLYFTSATVVYQVDTEAEILKADTVAVYDGFLDPFATNFYLLGTQPDGKIYINSNNGVKSLHRIEYPDSAGIACQVNQHSIPLAGYNAWVMHRYPNVWLGPTACDTTSLVNPASSHLLKGIRVLPNPASVEVQLIIDGAEGHPTPWPVSVFDAQGRLVYQGAFAPWAYIHRIPVSTWPIGIYYFQVSEEHGVIATGSLVVGR